MKLYYNLLSDDPIYYAEEEFREGDQVRRRNVYCFGRHSDLLKIMEDPLSYVQEEIRKMNEGIFPPFMCRLSEDELPVHDVPVVRRDNVWNIGYFFLQSIMKDLHLGEFLKDELSDEKEAGEFLTVLRFLVYFMILASSHFVGDDEKWADGEIYYERPGFSYEDVKRFMGFLEEHSEEYLSWLTKETSRIRPFDTSVLYYVDWLRFGYGKYAKEGGDKEATWFDYNFEYPDELLLVRRPLLLDRRKIPYMLLPRQKTYEEQTVLSMVRSVHRLFPDSTVIANAGTNHPSLKLLEVGEMDGDRVFGILPLRKALQEKNLKEALLQENDYHLLSNNRAFTPAEMKALASKGAKDSRIRALKKDTLGKTLIVKGEFDLGQSKDAIMRLTRYRRRENMLKKHELMILFSEQDFEEQKAIREKKAQEEKKLSAMSSQDGKTKAPEKEESSPAKKTASRGKEAESSLLSENQTDMEEYDGYTVLVTNRALAPGDLLNENIDQFQIGNYGNLGLRHDRWRTCDCMIDVYPHALLLICYTAALVFRLLEVKLEDQGTPVSPQDLAAALQETSVVDVEGVTYQPNWKDNETIDALVRVTGLPFQAKFLLPQTLDELIRDLY